ncbi:MAG: P-loop NTPase fold protein, partial [Culicoidibacterales bacterium]
MNKKTIQLALWILLGLTIIDILNVPSIVINQIPLNFEEISLVGLLILIGVLLGISYVQWFKTIRTKILEMPDKLTTVLLSIVIFYGIINIIPGFELTVFKFQLLCIPAIMLVCIIALLQMRKQFLDPEAPENTLQTVFDLHDLNDESKFTNWNPEQFILLKETPDTVDLLNRNQTIVPELKRTITNCYYSEGGFVVALTGSWGCGKTTVINLVTEELKGLTIINDFSFWEYENKEALLKAVIERLLEESDSVLNFFERRAFIQSVLEMVSDKSGFNFQRLFANGDELSKAKKQLSTHFKKNNKRILFVVDDLERTNSEIAVMIFKVIATVLDIGNVIYLVSYDEVEMKKHFSTVGIE